MRKFSVTTKKHQRNNRTKHTRKQQGRGVGFSRTQGNNVNRIPYLEEINTVRDARRIFGPPIEDFAQLMSWIPSVKIPHNKVKRLWSTTDLTGRSLANTNYIVIICENNQLTQLPILPNNLLSLFCNNNQLTQLPILPNSLTNIDCGHNQLTQLPMLPNNLYGLKCGDNQLTQLPTLPNSLKLFDCANNQLTQLSTPLPSRLQGLVCQYNNLAELPRLPNSLMMLGCNNNKLSRLPELPLFLQNLACQYNNLTELPELPFTLNMLSVNNNQLTYLPNLPDSTKWLFCGNNPLISLPRSIRNIMNLYLSFDQFDLLSNTELNDSVKITVVDSIQKMTDDKVKEYNRKWREFKNQSRNRNMTITFSTPIAKSRMNSAADRANFNLATRNPEYVEGSNANMSNLPKEMVDKVGSYLGGRRKRRRSRKHKK